MVPLVIDTNVLLAALIAPDGPNMRALRAIVGNLDCFEVCFSSQILSEYEDVLSRPIVSMRGLDPEARALLSLVKSIGHEVVPTAIDYVVYPDRKDKPFLEAAIDTKAVLITNNLKDFPFVGVVVLGPEDFLLWCDEQGIHAG